MPRRTRSAHAPVQRTAPRQAPAPRAAPSRVPAPAPPSAPPAQAQQSAGGGMLSGIASTVAQGFAFGTGSAVAHRAVGAMMGGGSSHPAPVEQAPAAQAPMQSSCGEHQQAFFQCLQQNQGNANACQFYFDTLTSCQAGQL